jgi:hypothetical protein
VIPDWAFEDKPKPKQKVAATLGYVLIGAAMLLGFIGYWLEVHG